MQLIGQIGEHLVAADLMKKGFPVLMAGATSPYDLAVEVEGQFYRVQVKATERATWNKSYVFRSKGSKHRNYDLIAFVAIDCGAVAYKPFYEAANNRNVFKPPQSKHHGRRKGRNLDQYPFHGAIKQLIQSRVVIADQQ